MATNARDLMIHAPAAAQGLWWRWHSGTAQCRRGDYAGALDALARAAPIMKAQYPTDAWRSAWVENTRGACLLRHGDKSGRALVRASAPVVLKRWKPETLYGHEVQQRLRLAA